MRNGIRTFAQEAHLNQEVDGLIESLNLDRDKFEHLAVMDRIRNPLNGVWTAVYDTSGFVGDSTHAFCCIADTALKDEILTSRGWAKHSESFGPGFCESATGTWYINGQDEGFEYLVATQYFHAFGERQILINPEFILLFHLYRGDDGNYFAVDECGEKTKVIDISDDLVRIRTSYLMRYIAAKQKLFIQFIDSRMNSVAYPLNGKQIYTDQERSENFSYFLSYQTSQNNDCLFTMLQSKSVVYPQSIDQCGLWPHEDEEDFPEFIIKELPDGSYERFTCNPDKLGDYFGGNPGAPHYLTPVFFKPSVLDRYRKNKLFDVQERRLSCGTMWSVEIDHVDSSRVMLFLGDLGSHVPSSERAHFKEHEMPPTEQSISEEVFASSICGVWQVEPTGPVSKFFFAYKELNQAWKNRFGWDLYRKFHPDDSSIERAIRIPTSDSVEEFETVVLNLAKLLVDYIDESRLKEFETNGGISKLDEFLKTEGVVVDMNPIRNLYALRSSSIAHSKGSKFDKLKAKTNLTGNAIEDTKALLEGLTIFMNELTGTLQNELKSSE